jgi:hypothetical protein
MISGSAIHVSAGCSRIATRRDKLRLTVRSRARLPQIDDARPLIAHAATGSEEEPGCSKDHAL